MIPEKVAAQKGQNMVPFLASGVVGRVVVLTAMGEISAKVKELKRAQYRRNHPEKDQIFHRKPDFQDVIGDRHQDNLNYRDIFFQKAVVPRQKSRITVVVVGVVARGGMLVVEMVFAAEPVVIIECK